MGSAFSSSSQRGETHAERQKRLQEEHGVLIPPSFLSPTAPMPPSCQCLCQATTTPDLLHYLWATNPGRRLLQDHVSPGVWLSVGPSRNQQILVSLDLGGSQAAAVSSKSLLWAQQTFEHGSLQALVPTAGEPSLTASFLPIPNHLSLSANVSADGKGWVGARLQLPKDGIHMLLGSYIPFDPQTKPSTIHAYGAAEYKSSYMAVQAAIPFSVDKPLKVSTMVSLNVNDDASPPLWVTLKQQRHSSTPSWIMNLSQTLTFDRHVFNLLEDRAPKVRQTLGWVVQLENDGQSQQPQLSVGGIWQWNRGFGMKAIVTDQKLVYGVILKKWIPPRMTFSLWNQLDFATTTHSFMGVGIELEATDNGNDNGVAAEYQSDPKTSHKPQQETPVTKIHLPTEMK